MKSAPDTAGPAAIAQAIAMCALVALVILQPLWHGWLLPPRSGAPALAAAIAVAPWLPVLVAMLRNRRRGVLWGGALALFYFSHGVAVAWSGAGIERTLGCVEIALSLLLIVPPGTVAWRARRLARPAAR